MKKLSLSALLLLLCTTFVFAQNSKKPQASPHQVVNQAFALSHITVDYSRPGMKDRTVFGGLVPYGTVWRTGANAVTTVDFGKDVKLNGHDVKAGKYALYTIPSKGDWTIILNKDVKNWGTEYSQSDDVLKFKATPQQLPFPVETFTINFDQVRDASATMYLLWDRTYVPIKITTTL